MTTDDDGEFAIARFSRVTYDGRRDDDGGWREIRKQERRDGILDGWRLK